MAEGVKILSAGAVKPALNKIIDAFRRDHQVHAEATFATAPAIVQRIGAGEQVSVLIAPSAVLEELTKTGKCAAEETAPIGRIGVGVLVRAGSPLPRIATIEDLKQSLLGAESIIYNRASTGAYLEKLFDSLGIAAALARKSLRYDDFSGVLDHIRRGGDKEIGFGATTVIVENLNRGIQFAGALPAEIQNYTCYIGAALSREESGARFIRYLASPAVRAIFRDAGID
jgi:molybdate transport system substrate-binding protein